MAHRLLSGTRLVIRRRLLVTACATQHRSRPAHEAAPSQHHLRPGCRPRRRLLHPPRQPRYPPRPARPAARGPRLHRRPQAWPMGVGQQLCQQGRRDRPPRVPVCTMGRVVGGRVDRRAGPPNDPSQQLHAAAAPHRSPLRPPARFAPSVCRFVSLTASRSRETVSMPWILIDRYTLIGTSARSTTTHSSRHKRGTPSDCPEPSDCPGPRSHSLTARSSPPDATMVRPCNSPTASALTSPS